MRKMDTTSTRKFNIWNIKLKKCLTLYRFRDFNFFDLIEIKLFNILKDTWKLSGSAERIFLIMYTFCFLRSYLKIINIKLFIRYYFCSIIGYKFWESQSQKKKRIKKIIPWLLTSNAFKLIISIDIFVIWTWFNPFKWRLTSVWNLKSCAVTLKI